jgi:hypothetical protein
MNLPRGLYDRLVTSALARRLEQLADSEAVLDALFSADAAPLLADFIAQSLSRVLEDAQGDPSTHSERQLAVVNALLVDLRSRLTLDPERAEDSLPSPPRRLRAVHAVGATAPPQRSRELTRLCS